MNVSQQPQHSLGNKVLSVLIARFVATVSAFLSSIVVARNLGPAGQGTFTVVLTVPALLTSMSTFGAGHASAYYLARRQYSAPDVLGAHIVLMLIANVLCLFLAMLLVLNINAIISRPPAPHYLYCGLLVIPFILFISFVEGIFRGLQCTAAYNISQFLSSILFMPFALLAALIMPGNILATLLLYAFSWMLVACVAGFLILRYVGLPRCQHAWTYTRMALPYAFKVYATHVMWHLNFRLGILIGARFLEPEALGHLALAHLLSEKWMTFVAGIGAMLTPHVAGDTTKRSDTRTTPVLLRSVLASGVLALCFVLLLGKVLIGFLYGASFLESAVLLSLLLPGIVALSAATILGSHLAGRGYPGVGARIGCMTAVFNAVLQLHLVDKFSAKGSAMACSVAFISAMLVVAHVYSRHTGVTWRELFVPHRRDLLAVLNAMKRSAGLLWWKV